MMRRTFWVGVASTGVMLSVLSAPAHAALTYVFSQEGTGTVLAEIQLQTLPAGLSDILSYHLTPAGDAIFHFGTGNVLFTEFFALWGNQLLDDGSGGLKGSAPYTLDPTDPTEMLSSLDAPVTTLSGHETFVTGFYANRDDFLEFFADPNGPTARGHYVLLSSVPEPAPFALVLVGVVVCLGIEIAVRAFRRPDPIRLRGR